ncbi:hypothetical protein G5V57_21875 [Nordella sp. HKS 07]|uniref:hypothetical protein n=1 Tax=Nordella sp. HKS 07 TaxID=2712222 RepID=UPI0013E0EF84|nr:hypothetical protein [Nordella sp. HKS 07]QIG50136.1 hypothetical protein G5V57_21875 [Nordella sp. HKS 07]
MQEIFVQSQWDTLLAFLKEGRPPTWLLLALVNGGILAIWLYSRFKGRNRLNPVTVNLMRFLFIALNTAAIFREETLRLARPFLKYFI